MTLSDTARALHAAGACVLPAAPGKMPAVTTWKQHTARGGLAPRPSLEQALAMVERADGIGILTGAASGGIEMLEFEGRALAELVPTAYAALAEQAGHAELWALLCNGYLESTPSGGIHILYRVIGEAKGNTKLASRPARDDELDEREQQVRADKPDAVFSRVLIETRGEGGWTVLAPSGGRVHDKIPGGAWKMLTGSPDTIPTITAEQRDWMHQLAAAFDRMPLPPVPAPAVRATGTGYAQPGTGWEGGVSPGDDYNARTTWEEILLPYGWTRLHTDGSGVTYWRRPGKSTHLSASTGRGGADNLYVWSTSTTFDAERPYDKFGAYARLQHADNYSLAASALLGLGYGRRPEPLVSAPAPPVPALVAEPEAGGAELAEEVSFEHSDDGSALRLVDTYGEVIRYCPDRGRWITWNGVVWEWQPAGGGLVREYAKSAARSLPEGDKAAVTHKKRSLSAAGVTAALQSAETDLRIVVAESQLDAHAEELNTPGGIVDLRAGVLLPADASRLHTRMTLCAPDFEADDSVWRGFLATTFQNDQEFISYLQRLLGYSATGLTTSHVLPFCVGSGGNGKGVLLESVLAVFGGYASTAPSGFLMSTGMVQHLTEIARLTGLRFVVCSEVNEEDRFDEVKVKQLTGGDTLTARFMHKDHFSFTPTHKLWLMGNHQPAVKSGGRSFWRRLRLLGFHHEVAAEDVIEDLQGILAREHGPALLAWIVKGAADYLSGGLRDPDSVKVATNAYAADQDTVSKFVAQMCHLASSAQVSITKSKLREAYEKWCAIEGETPVSAKRLTMELTRHHGVGDDRSAGARSYTGICLMTADEPDGDIRYMPKEPSWVEESVMPDMSDSPTESLYGPAWQ